MPSEMVEKVAQALAKVQLAGGVSLSQDLAIGLARAAIAAMWLPTPAMIQKGLVERIADFNEYEEQYEALTEQWHAMISAALQEPTP